jgi:phosphatidyl-myo-inositol dimannoside synthase
VLEAAAGRVPLIASDVGGIPEILPAKNLFPPDNPDALARHIEVALAIPAAIADDAKALADAARTSFDARAMGRNVTTFYQRLLTRMENRS